VEQSLPEAKAAEQRVEHIFDPRSSGQPIERRSSHPKIFGNQYKVARHTRARQRVSGLAQM
jgi:hypothetical protein